MNGVIAVVPARGGSKGISRKNLVELGGAPLLAHTLRAAAAASTLDRVVVSTDDAEIAAVAEHEGAEVVARPRELSTDDSPTEAALLHVLDVLGEDPDYVVTLEPTSPFRSARLIDECVLVARERHADAVVTVTESRGIYGRLLDGAFVPFVPGQPRRRQEREPVYMESSTVYVTRAAHLRRARSVLGSPLYAVVVPRREALDINTVDDLAEARALFEACRHAA